MRLITEIVVHCTATRADWWKSKTAKQKVAEIRRWHVTPPRNWSDIGYHYLIDRDGTIVEGRPLERTGAHVKGRNRGTIGISLFGGHGGNAHDSFDDHFTEDQDKALRQLINDLRDRFGMLKLSGHNEYAAKACPCFNVRPWWGGRVPPPPDVEPVQPDPDNFWARMARRLRLI